MMMRVKEYCFKIASFWGLGERLGGSVLATALAIPVLFLLRACYSWLNATAFFPIIIAIALVSTLVIYLALQHHTDRDPSVIVLDKFLAFLVVFAGIKPSVKLIVVGFLLFHALRFFLPILVYRLWYINFYELPLRMFSALCSGVVLHIFFRLVLWLGS